MSNLNVNNITPQSGDNVSVSGSLIVSGTITANGNITLGDSVNDSVSFGAEISSSIVPDADDAYNLGSLSKQWKDLYIDGTAYIDSAEIGDVSSSLIPDADDTYDLGSPARKWHTLHVGTSASIATASINILNVSGSGVASNLIPFDDDTYDLGSSAKQWKDLYVDGVAYIDTLSPMANVSASSITIQKFHANSLDFASSTEYSVHGSKVEVRAITDGTIADGAFIEFKLKNTSIASDSIVLGSFTGGTVGLITGSILTAATIAASTASVQIHNETGGTIADDTPFTASFVVL